ncbi:MAG: amidohydrolase family protein [Lachnospiraceae bacterium]
MMKIDAHVHLWKKQEGHVNGKPVLHIGGGCCDFGGEHRQMMPPYMEDGENTVERFISNMDYAGINGAVITQESIDGNQDEYLLQAKQHYPERIKICSLYEENEEYQTEGYDGIKICAGRLQSMNLEDLVPVFKEAERKHKFLSIDLAEGDRQVGAMKEIIQECPDLRIAIGHFGMVTKEGWQEQIKLARNKKVYIESGGITWLFHREFYPYPSAMDAIAEAGELCGMDKLMWGSDYPRTMVAITYRMSQDYVVKSNRITEEAKRRFLGENAMRFYDFAQMEELPYRKDMLED